MPVRRKARRRVSSGRSLLLVTLFVLTLLPVVRAQETALIGLMINGQEVGTLEVLQQQETLWLPLPRLAELLGLQIQSVDTTIQLVTPLGPLTLEPQEFQRFAGVPYIASDVFARKFSAPTTFDQAAFALSIDLPWRRGVRIGAPAAPVFQPEVRPPAASVSLFRHNFDLLYSGDDVLLRNTALFGGRLAHGAWRLEVDDNFLDQPTLSEYFWYGRRGQAQYQVGRQDIRLHPLLAGIEMSGVQFGWMNRPLPRLFQALAPLELLPRRTLPVTILRGQAPPSSIAQLRLDGVLIAQQQVGFDGLYEFSEVPLAAQQSSQVEVWIFDRHNLAVPIETRLQRLNTSDLLLPDGSMTHLAGAGVNGNVFQDVLHSGTEDVGGAIGFYQWRQGFSEDLTIEATLQQTTEVLQGQVGLIWRPVDPVVLAVGVAGANRRSAYTLEMDWRLPRWRLLAASTFIPADFDGVERFSERYDHLLDMRYRLLPALELGVIGRWRRDNSGQTFRFLLPTFAWRPIPSLAVRGEPDSEGDYRVQAFYRPHPRLYFTVVHDDATTFETSYRFYREYDVTLDIRYDDDLPPETDVFLNRRGLTLSSLSFRVGFLQRQGRFGAGVGAMMQILPGVLARLDYQSIANRRTFDIAGDHQLRLSLTTDLALARGRLIPANALALSQNRGAVAGRIRTADGAAAYPLDNVAILTDGRPGTRTDAQGTFFLGNVEEGTHVIELDPAKLPFELVPVDPDVVAEVAGGTVTAVDFVVRQAFGLAGRVLSAEGVPVAGLQVQLLDMTGQQRQVALTDQFGLYRMDGIPVGTYTLHLPPQPLLPSTLTLPTRTVTLRNAFLFEQNLQLPAMP